MSVWSTLWSVSLCCLHGAFMWTMSRASNKLAAQVIASLLITENTVCIEGSWRPVFAARHEEAPQDGIMMNASSFFAQEWDALHVHDCVTLQCDTFIVHGPLRAASAPDASTPGCVFVRLRACLSWIMPSDFLTLQCYFPSGPSRSPGPDFQIMR